MTESEMLLGLIFTLIGVVIGALTTGIYLQSRYRAILNAVHQGSHEGLWSLMDDESRYTSWLGDALEELDTAQDAISTTRKRVADTLEWIKITKTEFEAFRGLHQMPPTLKNDSPARKDFGRA